MSVIRETPLQGQLDHLDQDNKGAAWSFPPLINPPRSAQQLVLSHGAQSAAGWRVGWAQIIGARHTICEDSMAVRILPSSSDLAFSSTGIYAALTDGVGGGARGDVASHTLALHCVNYMPEADRSDIMPEELIRAWMLKSDHAVTRAVRAVASNPGAATLAAVWLESNGLGWFSRVGDARAYLISGVACPPAAESERSEIDVSWQVRPVLHDQTYALLGEPAPAPELAHEPARMVGAGLIGNPEIVPVAVGNHDTLLLCSDGLHRFVSEEDIAALSAEGNELDAVACALVSLARARGSDDDISILILRRHLDDCFATLHEYTDEGEESCF